MQFSSLISILQQQSEALQQYYSFFSSFNTKPSDSLCSTAPFLHTLTHEELEQKLSVLEQEKRVLQNQLTHKSIPSEPDIYDFPVSPVTSWSIFEILPYSTPTRIHNLPQEGHLGYIGFRFSPSYSGIHYPPFHLLIHLKNGCLSVSHSDIPYFIPINRYAKLYLNNCLEQFLLAVCRDIHTYTIRKHFFNHVKIYVASFTSITWTVLDHAFSRIQFEFVRQKIAHRCIISLPLESQNLFNSFVLLEIESFNPKSFRSVLKSFFQSCISNEKSNTFSEQDFLSIKPLQLDKNLSPNHFLEAKSNESGFLESFSSLDSEED